MSGWPRHCPDRISTLPVSLISAACFLLKSCYLAQPASAHSGCSRHCLWIAKTLSPKPADLFVAQALSQCRSLHISIRSRVQQNPFSMEPQPQKRVARWWPTRCCNQGAARLRQMTGGPKNISEGPKVQCRFMGFSLSEAAQWQPVIAPSEQP